LGCENIIHAKDGIEGKSTILKELIPALEACQKEKFDLCFMGFCFIVVSHRRFANAQYGSSWRFVFTTRDGRIKCYEDSYDGVSGAEEANCDRHDC